MKTVFCVLLTAMAVAGYSQTFETRWTDEIKVKKDTRDYEITLSDSTGFYFVEKIPNTIKAKNSEGDPRYYYKLTKLDSDFKKEWDKDYYFELAEYDVFAIRAINDGVYILMTGYISREKKFKVFGARVNKSNGKLQGEILQLSEFDRADRKADFITAEIFESVGGPVVVTDLSGKKEMRVGVTIPGPGLSAISTIDITIKSSPRLFRLIDVKYAGGKIFILGKVYEEIEYPDLARKIFFKNIVLSVYDTKGLKLADLSPDQPALMMEARLAEQNGQLVFAGFYSNDSAKVVPDGICIGKIDIASLNLVIADNQQIAPGLFAKRYGHETEDDDKNAQHIERALKRKEKSQISSLQYLAIRSIQTNAVDSSLIIAAELLETNTYLEYAGGGLIGAATGMPIPLGSTPVTSHQYISRDIMLVGASSKGIIQWMNVIPKKQLEETTYKPLFFPPYYSSFRSAFVKEKYVVLYNDNKRNIAEVDYREKVRMITDFKKEGSLFAVSIDPKTGSSSKTLVADFKEDIIPMVTHAFLNEKTFIIPALRMKEFARSIYKVVSVSVQ